MTSDAPARRRGPATAVLAVLVAAGLLAVGWSVVAANRGDGPATGPSPTSPSAGSSLPSSASPGTSLPILTTPATKPTIAASPVR